MFSKNIQDKAEIKADVYEIKADVSGNNGAVEIREKTDTLKIQDIKKKDKEQRVKKEIVLQPKISKIKNKVHQEVQTIADNAAKENPENKVAVVLQLNDANNIPKISEVISSQGGNVKAEFSLGAAIIADIPTTKIQALAKENSVESIWPDREYEMLLDDSHDLINTQAAWNLNYTGKGVKIAILDTGIDENHEMFNGRVILSNEFTGEDHTTDRQGHGTHVAGIAAGNGKYKGVAPDAYLLNAKVLSDTGKGTTSSIIAGINWVVDPDNNLSTDNGADVISISIGGAYNDQDGPIIRALQEAIKRGVTVVIASGNCGNGCNGFYGVTTPGDMQEAITVGAVDGNNAITNSINNNYLRASFSSYQNFGTYSKPDIVAPGVSIISSVVGSYAQKSGTSMAAPFVAGAAALLIEQDHNLTNQEIKSILVNSAQDIAQQGKDTETGYGLLNLARVFNVDTFPLNITYGNETLTPPKIVCSRDIANQILEALNTTATAYSTFISKLDETTCITNIRSDSSSIALRQKYFNSALELYEYIKDNYNFLSYYNITSLNGHNVISLGSSIIWTNENSLVILEHSNTDNIETLLNILPSDFQSNYFEFLTSLHELRMQEALGTLNENSIIGSSINQTKQEMAYSTLMPARYLDAMDMRNKTISFFKNGTKTVSNQSLPTADLNFTPTTMADTCAEALYFDYMDQVMYYYADGKKDYDWFTTKPRTTDGYMVYLKPEANDDFDLAAYKNCNGASLGSSSKRGNAVESIFFSGYKNTVAMRVYVYNLISNKPYTLQLGPVVGNSEFCKFWKAQNLPCGRNEWDCDSDSECASGLKCSCVGAGCDSDSGPGYYDGCCNLDESWDGDSCEKLCEDKDNDKYYKQSGCGTSIDCNDADNTVYPTAPEVCDNKDNDCDGSIDEGYDLSRDNKNCGSCGNVCAANSQCTNGACVIQYSNITIQSIFNIIPSSALPNQQVSFTVKVKNIGNARGSTYIEGAVAPESWAGIIYPAEYSAETVIDNPSPVCRNNNYYSSKVVELNANEINDVVFNVIASNRSSVDACDTHTPKRSAWDTRFRIISGTYSSINGGAYESFAYITYNVSEPSCNFPYGTSAECSCYNAAHSCPASYICSNVGYGTCTAVQCTSDSNCAINEKCFNNKCVKICSNECTALGSYFCDNSAIVQCGQFDDDYCNDKKVIRVCREDSSCINSKSTCQSVNTKLQIEDAPKEASVYKQQGDWLSIVLNNNVQEDITFEYDSTAFTGSCQNGILTVNGKKECLFLVGDKPGSYEFKVVNGETKTVKVITNPALLIITDKKKLAERFSTSVDNNEIKWLLEQAYRTAERNGKKGVVYDLNEYRLEVGNSPWQSFSDYKETPTTSNITNDYPLKIASFIKDKCNGCKDTLILGDDYVVPYYRTNIPIDEFIGDRVDSIYTDTAYAQRTSKPFSEFDELFYFDKNLNGKSVRFLLPSAMTDEYKKAVQYLNKTLYTMNGSSLKPKVEFIDGNTVNCNDLALFPRFSQKTIFVIGTEENNRAFSCFPFAADVLYRDTATIERNPWDTKQFAVVLNTESPSVLYSISKTLENGIYKKLQDHSIFYLRIGSEIAWDAALIAGTTAIVVGTGGTGAIALTAEASLWTGTAIDLEKNCNRRDAQGSCTQAWIQVGIPVLFKYLGKPALSLFTKYPTEWLIKLLNKFGAAELYGTLKFYAKDIQLFDTILSNFDRALRLGVGQLENYYRFVASKEGKYIYGQYTFPKKGVLFDETKSIDQFGSNWGKDGRFFVADPDKLINKNGENLIQKLLNSKTISNKLATLKEIEEKLGIEAGKLSNGINSISMVEITDIMPEMWRYSGKSGWRPRLGDSTLKQFVPGGATINGVPEAVLRQTDITRFNPKIVFEVK